MKSSERYVRAAGIGFVSGMRSMTGPAAAQFRHGGNAAVILPLLALGEMVVDKLPRTPARTAAPALAVRALAGGFAGRSVAGDEADGRIAFALGALGAIGGAFLMLRLRTAATAKSGLPDPVIALIEDAAAAAAGYALTA